MITFRKLFLSLLTIFILILILSGCRDRPDEVQKVLVGNVAVIGNVPFTQLALRVDDETYILKCSKEIEDELWRMQGAKIIVYYTTITEQYGFKNVTVIRYTRCK